MSDSTVAPVLVEETLPTMEVLRSGLVGQYEFTQTEVKLFNFAYELVTTGHPGAAKKLLEAKNPRWEVKNAIEIVVIMFEKHQDEMKQHASLFL